MRCSKTIGPLLLVLVWLGTTFSTRVIEDVPRPSDNQLRALDIGLSMFIHFSVDPFTEKPTEHNCPGRNPNCIPASLFNPTNLSTDQWVETAVAFGAQEICLTAHHEGGFCLWDTNYTDYSVMHSPYGKDVVQQFVASCKKYNVKPCYYLGPNANGYLSNMKKLSAEEFIQAQLGMTREILTKYDLQPGRLWWDHYPRGCNDGLDPCPDGAFPAAWTRFIDLVREVSPETILCPGPDCDGHHGESGRGQYPSWNPCQPTPDGLQCQNHSANPKLKGFHYYDACATMTHHGWMCHGDGSNQPYWTAGEMWDHYMKSVGIGWTNTLNAPVCTTGQIYPGLVKEMTIFGKALKSLFATVHASKNNIVAKTCDNNTLVELTIDNESGFNAIVLKEDLSKGQRILKYALDYYSKDTQEWLQFKNGVHGRTVGNLLIDLLDEEETAVATKVRLRCLRAMQTPVHIKRLSAHSGARPGGRLAAEDAVA